MNRKKPIALSFCILSAFFFFSACSSGDKNNRATTIGDNLPSVWSNNKNIRWIYTPDGKGWSSPVIYGNKVFITTGLNETKPQAPEEEQPQQHPQGPPPAAGANHAMPQNPQGPPPEDTTFKSEVWRLEVVCLDLKSGKELWKKVAYNGKPRTGSHQGNGYASETPVTDGQRVYAYFGMTGIYCYDLDGNQVWQKDLGAYKTMNAWGTGSSPILYNGTVYLQIDNEENSFIVALDAATGAEKWRTSREEKTNYSTPFIWKNTARAELVTCGSKARAYDPETGKLLWEMKIAGKMAIPSPVGDNDHLYIGNTGGMDGVGSLSAVKAGASGDITVDSLSLKSSGVEWSRPDAATGKSSPVLYKGLIYILADNGKNLGCFDAATGKTIYNQTLEKTAGCYATPWVYKDILYLTDERGTTLGVKTGEKFELVSENRIKDKFWASAALGFDAYVFKGANKIYCVAEVK